MKVIGTNSTGNLQFMDPNNSCLVTIDEHPEEIAADWHSEAAGHTWSVPLVLSTRECLRSVFDYLKSPGSASQTARRVQNSVQSIFPALSLDSIGKRMINRLEDILLKTIL